MDHLTVNDLAATRSHSTGTVWPLRCPPCTGACNQGRDCPAESCAPEGGVHADPVESMHRHRAAVDTVKYGFALAVLLAVLGYVARGIWP